jgi:hypothetical protein
MSRKPVAPPEILYEYADDGDAQAINDAFNYLFDRYFQQLEKDSKE